jgi:hypothetical protein
MNAGRELDALVAEKVMGYTVTWREVRSVRGNRREPVGIRSFSTDITSAMLVLAQLGGIVTLTRMKSDEWMVSVAGAATRWAETLPLAICLAALAAVEMKVSA